MRVLLIGGDASAWIGISSALRRTGSQVFMPKDIDLLGLAAAHPDIDVVIAVIRTQDDPGLEDLRLVCAAGMAGRTLVIADPNDHKATAESLALGVAGYMVRGSSFDRVGMALDQVASGGVFVDAPLASLLRDPIVEDASAKKAAKALAYALELKDSYTGGHAERVTAMAMRLADAALLEGALPGEELEAAFLLHDVGKIGIPESILGKPGGLTETERRILQTHPILGERIISPLGFPRVVRDVIRHHHERWDGRGYPDGLREEQIPPAARIFAIADVLDALTSLRPYRRPLSFEDAMTEVMAHAGAQFDPALCDLAEKVFDDIRIPL